MPDHEIFSNPNAIKLVTARSWLRSGHQTGQSLQCGDENKVDSSVKMFSLDSLILNLLTTDT